MIFNDIERGPAETRNGTALLTEQWFRVRGSLRFTEAECVTLNGDEKRYVLR